ncbi:MAG TPA: flavodoxin domain-containing protein [Polyangiaceae bacterium]|jgi:sulfite reductase (NADPH) flavoprotein alpha-component
MQTIFVLFGSESNNAADLADRTGIALKKAGFEAEVRDMSSFDVGQFDSLETLLVVTSTYGNGNPPSNAEALHGALMSRVEPLPNLRFAVCGLGDTTYDHFAQCGKDFDKKLGDLGATRIADRQDCDVDYEDPWQEWLDRVLEKLETLRGEAPTGVTSVVPPPAPSQTRVHAAGTRKNPLPADLIDKRALSTPGSTKETIHVELGLDPRLAYTVGDSLGIFCENDPAVVDEIVRALGAKGDEAVTLRGALHEGAHGGGTMTLREALLDHLDIQHVEPRLFAACGLPKSPDVHAVDLVHMKTEQPEPQAFVEALRPLAPRAYSIASSPLAHPGQAHLTVDVIRYEMRNRKRAGVASSMLADRSPPGTKLSVYLLPAPHFRLPAPDVSIVMIGPGTGVAPFRAFLEERAASGAKGKNWLFFGTRHEDDVFYTDEFRRAIDRGTLTRLDCAYSRDQPDRVYVQHKMRAAKDELRAWLDGGAHVYVCGDAQKMAPDVQAELLGILDADRDRALERLRAMEAEGRYCKDVY